MTLEQLQDSLHDCEMAVIVRKNGSRHPVWGPTARIEGKGVVVDPRNTTELPEDAFPYFVDPDDVDSVECMS